HVDEFVARSVLETFSDDHRHASGVNIAALDAIDEQLFDTLVKHIEIHRDFGNQDGVRATGDATAHCRVSGIAPEHFQHDDAVVRAAGGLQIAHFIGDAVDRRIETDAVRHQVEVHRLRRVHTGKSLLGEIGNHAARVVSAGDHQPVDAELGQTV